MTFDSMLAAMPHVKSGKLRVFVVASGKRVAMLPDVPTMDESGVKDFEANNPFGFSAPKGTPSDVVATRSKAIQTAPTAPDLRQRTQERGVDLKFTPAAEFGIMVEQEFRAWGKAIETAKVKLD